MIDCTLVKIRCKRCGETWYEVLSDNSGKAEVRCPSEACEEYCESRLNHDDEWEYEYLWEGTAKELAFYAESCKILHLSLR